VDLSTRLLPFTRLLPEDSEIAFYRSRRGAAAPRRFCLISFIDLAGFSFSYPVEVSPKAMIATRPALFGNLSDLFIIEESL